MKWHWRRPSAASSNSVPELEAIAQLLSPADVQESSTTQPVAVVVDADDLRMEQLAAMARRIMLMRKILQEMFDAMRQHAETHADSFECDTWCGPVTIAQFLKSLSRDDLQDLFVVLYKDYFWWMENSQMATPSREDEA